MARRCYERAAELMPGAADPPARLAALAARLGDWPAARAHGVQALSTNPRQPLAIIALAGAELADRKFDDAERRLTALRPIPPWQRPTGRAPKASWPIRWTHRAGSPRPSRPMRGAIAS